jgi:hypothetical protein
MRLRNLACATLLTAVTARPGRGLIVPYQRVAATGGNFTPRRLAAILQNHIRTVLSRLPTQSGIPRHGGGIENFAIGTQRQAADADFAGSVSDAARSVAPPDAA